MKRLYFWVVAVVLISATFVTVVVPGWMYTTTPAARVEEGVESRNIAINCIGDRAGKTYAETGQATLFNHSDEGFPIDTDGTYYTFEGTNSRSLTFTPKIPQIGAYSMRMGTKNSEITSGLFEVQGLYYECETSVEAVEESLTTVNITDGATSVDRLRIVELGPTTNQTNDSDNNGFRAIIAFSRSQKYVFYNLTCVVTSRNAKIRVYTDENSRMRITTLTTRENGDPLPPRAAGQEPNLLERAVENALGNKGMRHVERMREHKSEDWLGVTAAITSAHGIRAAWEKGWSDRDDSTMGTELKEARITKESTKPRVWLLWSLVSILAISRFIRLVLPPLLSGDASQLRSLLNAGEYGCAGPLYRENNPQYRRWKTDEEHREYRYSWQDDGNNIFHVSLTHGRPELDPDRINSRSSRHFVKSQVQAGHYVRGFNDFEKEHLKDE